MPKKCFILGGVGASKVLGSPDETPDVIVVDVIVF